MALKDELRGRDELLKNGTLKQKLAYFFDYYTIHTVVILAILIFAISFIYKQVTAPDIVLNGMLLNVINNNDEDPVEDLRKGFLKYIGVDTKEYDVSFNSSLFFNIGDDSNESELTDFEASQAIVVQCAAGDVDFLSSPLRAILDSGYGEIFVPLDEVLSKEELELYKPYILYIDGAVLEKKNEATDKDQDPSKIPCPDPTKPEEMEDPIPIFIDVTKCKPMADVYSRYKDETLAVAISVNAPNPDRISDFLEYLFKE